MTDNTTAYVASTLPVAVLDKKIAEWGVSEVVLQGRTHLASYGYLQQRHPTVILKVLPASFVLGVIHLMGVLLWIKLSRRRLVFFHECCCPVFDVLVKVIKPVGDYYPQVTLNSFLRVESADVAATKLQKVILALGLEDWFQYYRGDLDNNEGYFFVQAAKSYPTSITIHEVTESRAILLAGRVGGMSHGGEKKILLLCGRDVAEDLELKSIYSQVIELATSLGFTCYLKDHPAKHARLNLEHKNACMIDPAMPLELLEDNFKLAIGVASTGLLHFSSRGISVIKLLTVSTESVRERRIAHLDRLSEGASIKLPENFSELRLILIKADSSSRCESG
jgi:hypothetical protein